MKSAWNVHQERCPTSPLLILLIKIRIFIRFFSVLPVSHYTDACSTHADTHGETGTVVARGSACWHRACTRSLARSWVRRAVFLAPPPRFLWNNDLVVVSCSKQINTYKIDFGKKPPGILVYFGFGSENCDLNRISAVLVHTRIMIWLLENF